MGVFSLALVLLFAGMLGAAAARENLPSVDIRDLPPEAQHTLRLIQRGGPFPYGKDGSTFGNYEKILPPRPRGHYREYTVPTPGVRHRGARRIVTGPVGEFYYTADHYRTFKRIRERR
ncbi:MAG: Guanyl-specific ribonuclease Sa [Betaproteobacteria bacterium ADurb.Bin341]|nr:MAG: Guanyl-specific ribonuclease Sa [Betaproteobacteria bacterium ADurb.Bin341]